MLKRLYYIIKQRAYVFFNRNKPCRGKVYMFHNVNEDHDTYAITKEHFESFLNELIKNKKIVDLETLTKEKDPDNVVITFDDVYDSVYHNAYPFLKEKDIPYYLFISNEYLDQEGYLSREIVKEMLEESKAIVGSHGWRHVLSRPMQVETLREDLIRSREALEALTERKVDVFAFPYGSMYACAGTDISEALKQFTYVCMTYALPYNENCGNVIPRLNMNDETYRREFM